MNGYGKDDWILTTSDKKWTGNGPEMDQIGTNIFKIDQNSAI